VGGYDFLLGGVRTLTLLATEQDNLFYQRICKAQEKRSSKSYCLIEKMIE
jgi:hypothetical protein